MSYAETYALTNNPDFRGRVTAASSEQALIFINDARPEYVAVANEVILSSGNALQLVDLVAAQPGINEASTDGDILAALQAVWPQYGSALLSQDAPAV